MSFAFKDLAITQWEYTEDKNSCNILLIKRSEAHPTISGSILSYPLTFDLTHYYPFNYFMFL
jgi:hypothetical protein